MDIRATVETVITSVPPGGQPYIDHAVAALEAREAAIVESLRAYATGRGLSPHEIDNALRGAGLLAPEPTPTVDGFNSPTLEQRVTAVEQMGQRILDAARRNGITI